MSIRKIEIRASNITLAVETDGEDAFELLKSALSFARDEQLIGEQRSPKSLTSTGAAADPAHASEPIREGTINTVTSKFGGGSAREILHAAAIYLTFYLGKTKWNRAEWIETAKEARDWKTQYNSNAARDVGRMVKSGEINENAADLFSLPTLTLAEVESQLG